jgi:hypothetical protein
MKVGRNSTTEKSKVFNKDHQVSRITDELVRISPEARRYRTKVIVVVAVVGLFIGCTTIFHSGAPEPSFDVNKDLEQLAKQFAPGDSITNFFQNPSEAARNKFIIGRITLMNIRYIQFIRKLTSERQLLDSATDMLVLTSCKFSEIM